MNPRVLALSQATIHLLKAVNVWDDLARQMPYTGMQVWNLNGYGEINFTMSLCKDQCQSKPWVLWLSQVY